MIDRVVEQARSLVLKNGKALTIEGAREGALAHRAPVHPEQLRQPGARAGHGDRCAAEDPDADHPPGRAP